MQPLSKRSICVLGTKSLLVESPVRGISGRHFEQLAASGSCKVHSQVAPLGRSSEMQASTSAPRVSCARPTGRRCNTKHVARAEAELSSSPARPTAPTPPMAPKPTASTTPKSTSEYKGVTIEYQRAQAKEMVAYFKSLAEDKLIENSKVFGWTPANEINNGRWVMMGVGIGLLTEYATGVDFIHQLQLLVSYLGILDLD